MYVRTYVRMYVCMYVCIYIYIYIYINNSDSFRHYYLHRGMYLHNDYNIIVICFKISTTNVTVAFASPICTRNSVQSHV